MAALLSRPLATLPAALLVAGCLLPAAKIDEDVPEGSGGSGRGGSSGKGGSSGTGGSSGSSGSSGSGGSSGGASECDPARPATPRSNEFISCPSGQGCYLGPDEEFVCATAGTAVPGETCGAPNDCAAGFYCSNDGICREYCLSAEDCATECYQFSDPYYAGTSAVGTCLFPPDLQIVGWSAQSFQEGTAVYFCLNALPDGTAEARGEYIDVLNAGDMATTSSYQIAVGLVHAISGQPFVFSDRFVSEGPQPSGITRTWEGPFCVAGDVSSFEPGDYHFFVLVDDLNEVNEGNEENNLDVATSVFTIGTGPAAP